RRPETGQGGRFEGRSRDAQKEVRRGRSHRRGQVVDPDRDVGGCRRPSYSTKRSSAPALAAPAAAPGAEVLCCGTALPLLVGRRAKGVSLPFGGVSLVRAAARRAELSL